MSKQADAKKLQGFATKPNTCGMCAHFSSIRTETPRQYGRGAWVQESHMRCSLGGFKVGRSNICNAFAPASKVTT